MAKMSVKVGEEVCNGASRKGTDRSVNHRRTSHAQDV